MSDKYSEEHPGEQVSVEELKKLIQAELDVIDEYQSGEFEDAHLHELAISYINALHGQIDEVDACASTDYGTYKAWENAYNERVKILRELLQGYEVQTSQKYEATRSDILSDANLAQQKSDTEDALLAIAESAEFVFESNNGYGFNGKATVTNNTGLNFKTVHFDIQMYDENGVRIETVLSPVNNWLDGESVILEAYTSSEVAPASVKVAPNYYEPGVTTLDVYEGFKWMESGFRVAV